MSTRRSVVTFVLALAAFVAIGAGLVLLPVGGRSASTAAHRTARAQPTSAARPTALATATASPTPATTGYALLDNAASIQRPGEPTRLVIAKIGLDAKVTEVGTTIENGKPIWETAAFAVGYYRGTAEPGTKGNTVMAGHISSPVSKKGDIFRHLPEVRIGDQLDVYMGDKRVSYEVSEIRTVPPTAVQVMGPTPDATLTLLTCYPDNVYSKRLVVVGKLLDPAT